MTSEQQQWVHTLKQMSLALGCSKNEAHNYLQRAMRKLRRGAHGPDVEYLLDCAMEADTCPAVYTFEDDEL